MRIYNFVLSTFLFFFVFCITLSSQTRSEVRVKLGALSYYIHTVEKEETLSSLSRIYHVTTRQIEEANPNIEDIDKINAGQKILIPNFIDFESQYPFSHWTIQLHKSKKGEKLKDIAKIHNSEVRDIKNLNQGISNKPNEGALVVVPVRRSTLKIVETTNSSVSVPTYDSNSPKNPALTFDWGNNSGSNDSLTKVIEKGNDNSNQIDCSKYTYIPGKESFTVSFLLPFNLDSDKLDKSGLYFLEGALLAIENLKRSGLSLNVNIMDISGKESMNKALTGKKLEASNLIIGPLSLHDIKLVANYAQSKEIAMVVPYESSAFRIAEKNPFVYQVYPSDQAIYKKLVSDQFDDTDINPILIVPSSVDSIMRENYRRALKDRFGTFNEYVHAMGQSSYGNGLYKELLKTRKNLLFVCSNKESFVSDLMDRLQVLQQKGYPIKIYGRSSWFKFRIIDIARYFDLNVHIVHPSHVDYANEDVKSFIRNYRSAYNNEPTQYAFQGYDVTSYFLKAMMKYGVSFGSCLPEFPAKLLQSNFLFRRLGEKGGYVNAEAYMLEFTPELDVVRY